MSRNIIMELLHNRWYAWDSQGSDTKPQSFFCTQLALISGIASIVLMHRRSCRSFPAAAQGAEASAGHHLCSEFRGELGGPWKGLNPDGIPPASSHSDTHSLMHTQMCTHRHASAQTYTETSAEDLCTNFQPKNRGNHPYKAKQVKSEAEKAIHRQQKSLG